MEFSGAGSSAIPRINSVPTLKDAGRMRKPTHLKTLSRSGSVQSQEPSPTKSRFADPMSVRSASLVNVTPDPLFVFVGPERKRFHANRGEAPYPFPCGLEELSRYSSRHPLMAG